MGKWLPIRYFLDSPEGSVDEFPERLRRSILPPVSVSYSGFIVYQAPGKLEFSQREMRSSKIYDITT